MTFPTPPREKSTKSDFPTPPREESTKFGFPTPPQQDGVVSVIIDRKSNAGNLIARHDSSTHIRGNPVGDRTPSPGEKWKASVVPTKNGPVTYLKPIHLLEVIEDYEPVQGTSANGSKRNKNSLEWLKNMDMEFTISQAESGSRRMRGLPKKQLGGSMNGLLKGKH